MIDTVRDLIESLQQLPPDARIGIDGEDWLFPITEVRLVESLNDEHAPFVQIDFSVADDIMEELWLDT